MTAPRRQRSINRQILGIQRALYGLYGILKRNRDNSSGVPHVRCSACSNIRAIKHRLNRLLQEQNRLEMQ